MIRYRVDVLGVLKAAGYTTYRIHKEKLLHEMSVQKLRKGEMVSWAVLNKICTLLDAQPGDLLEYVADAP